jgi:hypothetical protein
LPPQNFTLAWITTAHPDIFSEQCRMVYFADEDYSLTIFAIVNGGLYYLFQERAWYVEGEEKAELLRYMAMCRDNFETALVNLPLLLPARKESVEVLVMAVSQILWWTVVPELTCSLVNICHRGIQILARLEIQHHRRHLVSDPWIPPPAAARSSGSRFVA